MAMAGFDMSLLEEPDTTIPMSAYIMPALGGLVVGVLISLGYVYFTKK